jgi:hypothetical protein
VNSAARLDFPASFPLTPTLSRPTGEGVTLCRVNQGARRRDRSLATKTKPSFVGFCGWSSTQPRSVTAKPTRPALFRVGDAANVAPEALMVSAEQVERTVGPDVNIRNIAALLRKIFYHVVTR